MRLPSTQNLNISHRIIDGKRAGLLCLHLTLSLSGTSLRRFSGLDGTRRALRFWAEMMFVFSQFPLICFRAHFYRFRTFFSPLTNRAKRHRRQIICQSGRNFPPFSLPSLFVARLIMWQRQAFQVYSGNWIFPSSSAQICFKLLSSALALRSLGWCFSVWKSAFHSFSPIRADLRDRRDRALWLMNSAELKLKSHPHLLNTRADWRVFGAR